MFLFLATMAVGVFDEVQVLHELESYTHDYDVEEIQVRFFLW